MNKLTFIDNSTTLTGIAENYNISVTTLHKWLKPIKKDLLSLSTINKKRLRTLNSKQVEKIYSYLGYP